jgi:hypothetical protein
MLCKTPCPEKPSYCDSDLLIMNATGMPLLVALSLTSMVNKYTDSCTLDPLYLGMIS